MSILIRRKQQHDPGVTSDPQQGSFILRVMPADSLRASAGGKVVVAMQPGVDDQEVTEATEVIIVNEAGEEVYPDGGEIYAQLEGEEVAYINNIAEYYDVEGAEAVEGAQYDALGAEEEVADFDSSTKKGVDEICDYVVNSAAASGEATSQKSKRYQTSPRPKYLPHRQPQYQRQPEPPPLPPRRPPSLGKQQPAFRHSLHIAQTYGQTRKRQAADVDSDSVGDRSEEEEVEERRAVHHRRLLYVQPEAAREKPKKREYAHRLQWNPDAMKAALDACNNDHLTIRGAAKRYGVPYSTLKDRVNGSVQHGVKPGVKTVLSPEEEAELEDCIRRIKDSGFQVHCMDIRERARELLMLNRGTNAPYQDAVPGHNWLAGFFKRHRGIEIKRSVNRNQIPSPAKQKQIVKSFFDVFLKVYVGLSDPHRRVYTLRDVPLASCASNGAGRGSRVLVAASCDGSFLPPFVVFRAAQLAAPPGVLQRIHADAYYHATPTGRINAGVLFAWFERHFAPHLRRCGAAGAVLLTSEPIGHISVRLVKEADAMGVRLVCVPSGVAHLVQPLSDEMVGALDAAVGRYAGEGAGGEGGQGGRVVTQQGIACGLHKVWTDHLPSAELRRGFADNGLVPLNPRAISMTRIMASVVPPHASTPLDSSPESPAADDYEFDAGGRGGVHDAPADGLELLSHVSAAWPARGPPGGLIKGSGGEGWLGRGHRSRGRHMGRPAGYTTTGGQFESGWGGRRGRGQQRVTRGGRWVKPPAVYDDYDNDDDDDEEYKEEEVKEEEASSPTRKHCRVDRSPVSSRDDPVNDSSSLGFSSPGKSHYTARCPPSRWNSALSSGADDQDTCSRTRPSGYTPGRSRTSWRSGTGSGAPGDIHSEIAAARNVEQINLAICSITEGAPGGSAASSRQPAGGQLGGYSVGASSNHVAALSRDRQAGINHVDPSAWRISRSPTHGGYVTTVRRAAPYQERNAQGGVAAGGDDEIDVGGDETDPGDVRGGEGGVECEEIVEETGVDYAGYVDEHGNEIQCVELDPIECKSEIVYSGEQEVVDTTVEGECFSMADIVKGEATNVATAQMSLEAFRSQFGPDDSVEIHRVLIINGRQQVIKEMVRMRDLEEAGLVLEQGEEEEEAFEEGNEGAEEVQLEGNRGAEGIAGEGWCVVKAEDEGANEGSGAAEMETELETVAGGGELVS